MNIIEFLVGKMTKPLLSDTEQDYDPYLYFEYDINEMGVTPDIDESHLCFLSNVGGYLEVLKVYYREVESKLTEMDREAWHYEVFCIATKNIVSIVCPEDTSLTDIVQSLKEVPGFTGDGFFLNTDPEKRFRTKHELYNKIVDYYYQHHRKCFEEESK